jgi:hypothetical protein
MPLLKPTRGLKINLGHPLARGLVGCYLFNEGGGKKVFNVIQPSVSEGTLEGGAAWKPGGEGFCIEFAAGGNAVNVAHSSGLAFDGYTDSYTVIIRAKGDSQPTNYRLLEKRGGQTPYPVALRRGAGVVLSSYLSDGIVTPTVSFGTVWNSVWHTLGFVVDHSANYLYAYKDGIRVDSAQNTVTATTANSGSYYVGNSYLYSTDFVGQVAWLFIYNRALSAAEIAQLYREPFCMFEPRVSPCLLSAPAGQIVSLAGTCAAGTDVTALLKVICRCAGAIAAGSDITALLKVIYRCAGAIAAHSGASASLTLVGEAAPAQEWFAGSLNIEQDWLAGALFGGMTANAFKLGTVLSLGWFWMRRSGCSVLYRGPAMDQIDFTNALTVAEQDAGQISPPLYVAHGSSSTYFYAVRRVNTCGYREHTLAAVAKVAIDADGNLAAPQPNNIFAAAVRQVNGNKVRLTWFYCPLRQKSKPVCFRIYHDAASGQVDYQNPIGTITYEGQRFYSYLTEPLAGGRYLFALRAEDADGVQNGSLARSTIQLVTEIPEAVDILSAESL